MKVYNKLVRDKIPDIIAAAGNSCTTRTLTDAEYLQALDAKLVEEMIEYGETGSVEELADLLEVIYAAAAARGVTAAQLDAQREWKAHARGRFEEKIFLESVDEKPPEQKYTLEEIAKKICGSYCRGFDECSEICVGFNYCRKDDNGALAWLRKVVNRE